jgi:hypothetical protein
MKQLLEITPSFFNKWEKVLRIFSLALLVALSSLAPNSIYGQTPAAPTPWDCNNTSLVIYNNGNPGVNGSSYFICPGSYFECTLFNNKTYAKPPFPTGVNGEFTLTDNTSSNTPIYIANLGSSPGTSPYTSNSLILTQNATGGVYHTLYSSPTSTSPYSLMSGHKYTVTYSNNTIKNNSCVNSSYSVSFFYMYNQGLIATAKPASNSDCATNKLCLDIKYPPYMYDASGVPIKPFPGLIALDWGDGSSHDDLNGLKQNNNGDYIPFVYTNACHTYTTPGDYNVTITWTTDCDPLTPTTTWTQIYHVGAPTVAITNTIPSVCAGTSATGTLSVGATAGASYLWSTGATNNSVNATTSAATTYTVTVTSANNCTASASSTVSAYDNCCTSTNLTLTNVNSLNAYITAHPSNFTVIAGVRTFNVGYNDVAINGPLVIDIPFTFNPHPASPFTAKMGANASIVIAPPTGSGYTTTNPMQVLFDNTVLTPCGAYWNGIVHESNRAKVTIQGNSKVENAYLGFFVNNSAAFKVNGSTFKDCYKGIQVSNSVCNNLNSSILATTFTAPALMTSYYNFNTKTSKPAPNPLAPWPWSIIGILADKLNYSATSQVFSIGTANTLATTADLNHFNNILTGIYINKSVVSVLGNDFNNIYEQCLLPSSCSKRHPYNGCGVYGFDEVNVYAGLHHIYVNTYGQVASTPSNIRFTNCDNGVKIEGSKCTVEYNPMLNVRTGVEVRNLSLGYNGTVHHNWITGTSVGVNVNGVSSSDINVTKNLISVNKPSRASKFGTGYTFQSPSGIYMSNVMANAKQYGGVGSHVAGNTITDGLAGIWLSACTDPELTISDWAINGNAIGSNTISFPTSLATEYAAGWLPHIYGIRAENNSSGFTISGNSIAGNSTDHGYGISHYLCSNYRTCGNNISTMHSDLRFYTDCPTDVSRIRGNVLGVAKYGLNLDRIGGNVGWVGPTIGSTAVHNNNIFMHNYTSGYDSYNNYPTSGNATHQPLSYFYNAGNTNTLANPPTNNISNVTAKEIKIFPTASCDANQCQVPCQVSYKTGADLYEDWMSDVATGGQSYDMFNEGTIWMQSKKLYTMLASNIELRNYNSSLQDFYLDQTTNDIGTIVAVERLRDSIYRDTAMINPVYAAQRLTALQAAITAIPASTAFGAQDKAMEQIYHDILEHGAERTLDSATVQTIADLAISCPYLEGTAVYKARALYSYVEPGLDVNDKVICCCDEVNYKRKPTYTPDYEPVKGFVVGEWGEAVLEQNPVSDLVSISYRLRADEGCTTLLYDIDGRQISSHTSAGANGMIQLDVAHLVTGTYIAKLQTSSGWSQTFKILIAR